MPENGLLPRKESSRLKSSRHYSATQLLRQAP